VRVAVAVSGAARADVDFVLEAERLGADSVWVAETWAYDALTPLAYLAARTERIRLATGIVQLGSRSPALLAMSAMSLQSLSGGRFLLGIGTSGPQVMEGWHGSRFERPVTATRETIEIIRRVSAGERLVHQGRVYQLPLPDSGGRALRSAAPPVEIPVYVAAMGIHNLELTGEMADGWLGNCFMAETAGAFLEPMAAGAARVGRRLSDIDLVIPAAVEFTEDEEGAARRHARGYAFTIGAMGGPDNNFYNQAFSRQGFGEEVGKVQALWLDGRREEAADAVPVELGRRTNLLGPPGTVLDRLRLYRQTGVGTIQAKLGGSMDERLATLATLLELCDRLGAEGEVDGEDPDGASGRRRRGRRMRYADGPSVEVDIYIDAPPAAVWAIASDVTTPSRFSPELVEVSWIDDVRFRGRSRHPSIGEWETISTVVANQAGSVFAWVVGDPENPSAQWRFTLEPEGPGTRLHQWMRMGPAPSGLNAAIEARPDKEERIIARRLEEHRTNMAATVEGIRDLAEGG
jgi:F420-dependent oxidoreductase-like protein